MSSPALYDLDGDGYKEIIFGGNDGYVYVLNYTCGLVWSNKTGDRVWSSPKVLNLSAPYIFIGSFDDNLYVFDASGYVAWKYQTKDYIISSPSIADIDQDGIEEIIIPSYDGYLYVLNKKRGFLSNKFNVKTWSSPAIADVNQDGITEIIVGADDKNLWVID
jgi:hypothetical protein